MNAPRPCALACRNRDGIPFRAAPGLLVCHRCSDKLRTLLADLERTYTALADINELIPGGHGNTGTRRAPGPRSPAADVILVHTDARSKWDGQPAALATVEAWAREAREENQASAPTGRITMHRELQTLLFHWDWLMARDTVTDFAAEMRAVLGALRIVHKEVDRALRVGKCPVVVIAGEDLGLPIDLECGAWLHVHTGATEITCRNCHTLWTRDRWPELADPWTDYAWLATELTIPAGTLRRWAHEDAWRTVRLGRTMVLRADAVSSFVRRRGIPLGVAG